MLNNIIIGMCGVNFTLFGCEEKILSNVHIVQWSGRHPRWKVSSKAEFSLSFSADFPRPQKPLQTPLALALSPAGKPPNATRELLTAAKLCSTLDLSLPHLILSQVVPAASLKKWDNTVMENIENHGWYSGIRSNIHIFRGKKYANQAMTSSSPSIGVFLKVEHH